MIPTLETPRLILRPLCEQDFDDLYEYAQDRRVADTGMWQPYESEAQAHADLTRLIAAYERGLMWWALEHKADHKMIGRCQLSNYDDEDNRAEISYALNSHYWGKSYITEAVQRVMQHGFEQMNLNRISAIVFPDNAASIRILEKAGMKQEGCLRQHSNIRGKRDDIHIYAVLREEWQRP